LKVENLTIFVKMDKWIPIMKDTIEVSIKSKEYAFINGLMLLKGHVK